MSTKEKQVKKPSYSEDDIALVRKIQEWLDEHDNNTIQLINDLTGIPLGTLRPLLAGQYNAKPTAKLVQIIDAVERQKLRDQDGRAELPHVETSVHKQIFQLIARAHRDRDIGIFAGNPGIGKTRGLIYYAMRTPGAAMVGASLGLTHSTFMKTLADACRVEYRRTAKADEIALEITKAVAGTDRIILVDEANYLADQSLEQLRRISDQCGIAVMLVGMPELIARIQGIEGRLGQLASRISFWPPVVRKIQKEDCDLLVKAY